MARHVFVSYQHLDQLKAKGFNLLSYAENVNLKFYGRHLLDPVDSKDPAYIERKVKEQIAGSSVTVVLIGKETADSDWVDREIQWSLEKRPPNGIVGIRLDPSVEIPEGLRAAGAERLDWFEPGDVREFEAAIERAALGAGRAAAMAASAGRSGPSCGR